MIYRVAIDPPDDLIAFRSVARRLLSGRIEPSDVAWDGGQSGTLFADAPPDAEISASVPRAFVELAETVVCHRDDLRWPLLYQALWRIVRGERHLMQQATDPLIHRLRRMATAVKHDQHHMTAFVRFRVCNDGPDERFIAWYEPKHRVLRRAAGFFVDRFASMRFSILTPDQTLHWDRNNLTFMPGLRRKDAVADDAVEAWWQRYYSAIFNPARVNAKLMKSHMPPRFWRDLPEARLIQDMLSSAGARTHRMIAADDPGVGQIR